MRVRAEKRCHNLMSYPRLKSMMAVTQPKQVEVIIPFLITSPYFKNLKYFSAKLLPANSLYHHLKQFRI